MRVKLEGTKAVEISEDSTEISVELFGQKQTLKLGDHTPEYKKFITELVNATNQLKAGQDALEVSKRALEALLRLMQQDPVVIASRIHLPIVNLLSACHNRLAGGEPPLFFKRPESSGGRPSDLHEHRARTVIVWALNLLVEKGHRELEALLFVAQQMARCGLVCNINDKPFSISDLKNWRKKARDGTGPKTVVDLLDGNFNSYQQMLDSVTTRSQAEFQARCIIEAVARHTPSG